MVETTTSLTNSDEIKSTCVKNVATRPAAPNYTTPTSNSSIRPARRCFELTTSDTLNLRDHQMARMRRGGAPRRQLVYWRATHIDYRLNCPAMISHTHTVYTTDFSNCRCLLAVPSSPYMLLARTSNKDFKLICN